MNAITNQPKERPILFSAPMVHAILSGKKTQTRRLVQLVFDGETTGDGVTTGGYAPDCSKGWGRAKPGDRLWVKETWTKGDREPCDCLPGACPCKSAVHYRADWGGIDDDVRWTPSIFMPRWASRITLEITGTRVERLQEISEEDAKAEGISEVSFYPDDGFPLSVGYMAGKDDGKTPLETTARSALSKLWDSINEDRASWESNPFVWVITFRKLENTNA
jgi:hypothetical protein